MGDRAEVVPTPEGEPPAPPVSREQLRSRRKREVRAQTENMRRVSKRELELGRLLYPEDEHADLARPTTRAECREGVRPCPFVGCRHHLYLDVSKRNGSIKVNFPDLEPWQLDESCSLDIAERGGVTLEEVGTHMNLTRERVRQVEGKALERVEAEIDRRGVRDELLGPGSRVKRRLPLLEPDEDGDELEDEQDFDVDRFASETLD